MSLASVDIPAEANVPPALEKLGVDPQSTLNCELLDKDFGLELRWTMAAPSDGEEESGIILQLVSRTASDRYLAFGIRHAEDQHSSENASNNAKKNIYFQKEMFSFQVWCLEMS